MSPEPSKQPRYRQRIDDGYTVIDGVNFVFGDKAQFFTTKPAALNFIESHMLDGPLLQAMYIVPVTVVSSEEIRD